ncbi:DUF1403 family protein [Mesorhizobium sp. M0954]|uniref:DUF1403 family protein n=1 Tax=Mesorhizobium sp. M0954 TaxID=2957032 RepID=UPI00333552F1
MPAPALSTLETLARTQAGWAGAWRQRLALKCAASMRLAGRSEDEAALRDACHLRQAGADPGPAGATFGAWRQLARAAARRQRRSARKDRRPAGSPLGRRGADRGL